MKPGKQPSGEKKKRTKKRRKFTALFAMAVDKNATSDSYTFKRSLELLFDIRN